MRGTRVFALAALSAAVLASAGAAAGQTLTGNVGPGFTISLTDSSGAPVTSLEPNDYTFQIHDQATVHSFHLVGPGVDQATQIETTSDPVWNLVLAEGTYTFYCDAHPTTMRGTFTVGTPPPPPPPPPPATRTKLLGRVGPGAKISLKTAGGAKVKSVTAGKFSIVVHDLSAADNFHLTGPGLSRKTGVAQKKTATWKVTFEPGTYRYRSDAHRKLKGSFQVKPAQ
jgi:plastocyanin